MEGGIVMVQRAIEPSIGKWSFPSGYVNRGEKIERAIEREVREECGLETVTDRLVGLYSEEGDAIVLAVYEARITGGQLQAGDHETLDVRVVDIENLPELAFDHDRDIITDWMATRSSGSK
jgi:ADP-ribose pyrophosphatase YjhB (NUDIX family)